MLPHVTVDLSACSHLGNAGIGAMIEVWQRTGVELSIAGPSQGLRNAPDVSGITRFDGIQVVEELPV